MAQRIDPFEEEASLLFGPGAVWRLQAGLMALHSEPAAKLRYVSALLELPEPAPLDRLFEAGPGNPFRPALRWAGSDAGKGPVAVPLIVEVPGRKDLRAIGLADLVGGLERHLAVAVPNFRRGAPGCRLRLGAPVPSRVVALDQHVSKRQWEPDPTLAGDAPLVVVAVIDDGLPFAHRALRDPLGRSRVEFCWLQGSARQPDNPWPAGGAIPTGREYFRGDIDALIAAHEDDEDVLYAAAGAFAGEEAYPYTLRRVVSHGSHVMVSAAAAAPDPAVRVIGVQLAPPVTLDTTGEDRWSSILQAFEYVLDRADRLAAAYGRPRLPLVINFSYGFTGGPHDGTGLIASRLRTLIDTRIQAGAPTVLTLPAGNSFQERLNGRLTPEPDADAFAADVPWQVPASDRTSSRLELWFAAGADLDRLALDVVDPQGTVTELAAGELGQAQAQYQLLDRRGAAVGRIWRDPHPARACIAISLAPTETPAGVTHAPAGRWIVRLRAEPAAALGGPVDIGIQRDFDPLGYRRGGRQSWLDTNEPRFDEAGRCADADAPGSILARFGSLNDLAAEASHTVVVGGFVEIDGVPAQYSSAGRLDAAPGLSVDCSAPSETGPALPGVPGAGTRSGAVVRLSGTSVAAPQVAWQFARASLAAQAQGNAPDTAADDAVAGLPDMTADGLDEPRMQARIGRARLRRTPAGVA